MLYWPVKKWYDLPLFLNVNSNFNVDGHAKLCLNAGKFSKLYTKVSVVVCSNSSKSFELLYKHATTNTEKAVQI